MRRTACPGRPPRSGTSGARATESIQGFATEISVNQGETVDFKIDTDATDYRIDIYRLGWYQGNGARRSRRSTPPRRREPAAEPALLIDGTTDDNLVDCGNWSVVGVVDRAGRRASGVYIAKPDACRRRRARATSSSSSATTTAAPTSCSRPSDTTWQAYNPYGGYSLYGSAVHGARPEASYNRPFTTRGGATTRTGSSTPNTR